MLGQRRRRCSNIKTALGKCLVRVVSSLVIRLDYSAESTFTVLYAEGEHAELTRDLRMQVQNMCVF